VTLSDLRINVAPIERAVTGDGNNRPPHLVEQSAYLLAIIDIMSGQLDRHDLTAGASHADMQFPPGPACPCAVFLDQPFAGTAPIMRHS
jgi:hypothetical protein